MAIEGPIRLRAFIVLEQLLDTLLNFQSPLIAGVL